jgi:HD-GYP domain-containing protein (c-di-GMP phosphodiesterase class II)
MEELERTRGTQFDPAVVDALLAVQQRLPLAA